MDRNIAALPDPPPPRQDRREATIEAALSHFDASGETRPERHAWPESSLRNRPQLGVLVAATLVAVICLPTLWVVLGNPQPDGHAPVALDALKGMPSLEAPPPSTTADTAREEAPAISAGTTTEPVRPSADAARAPALAPIEMPAPPPPAAVAMPAPAPAPLHPPEPVQVQAEAVVMSTFGAREAIAVRGDWNACTLNDPAHRLELCTDRISSAAKAMQSLASAFLSDGLLHGWQGDLDAAITAFNRAIEADPWFADAYLNRGLAYQRNGDLDRARDDLDKAVEYAPLAARTYYARSRLLRDRGKTRQASKDEYRALQLDPAYEVVIPPHPER